MKVWIFINSISPQICCVTAQLEIVIHWQHLIKVTAVVKIMALRAPKVIISFLTAPSKIIHLLVRQMKKYINKLALRVRAYPWILNKYLCVCVFVSFVPLPIILGTVFRLRICILVVESLWYLVEMLNIMQPHVFPMYVTFLHTFDTDSYINCWGFFVLGSCV